MTTLPDSGIRRITLAEAEEAIQKRVLVDRKMSITTWSLPLSKAWGLRSPGHSLLAGQNALCGEDPLSFVAVMIHAMKTWGWRSRALLIASAAARLWKDRDARARIVLAGGAFPLPSPPKQFGGYGNWQGLFSCGERTYRTGAPHQVRDIKGRLSWDTG